MDRRRAAPVDTSSEVDVDSIPGEAFFPTSASRPSGTPAFTSSLSHGSSTASQPTRITQAMILKIGHLAYSADMWATRSEMPLATTENMPMKEVAAAESKVETDGEQLDLQEDTTYEALTEVEEVMVDSVIQISLADTPMVGSGGASVDVTPALMPRIRVLHRALMPR
ncbi:hypothetical protein H5410_003205 [Solanum commersonii]|uniref:Polyprotein protein n=1 Tax=Solanum commersonii TaxID=4109 RepID=A0A9J6B4E1_SOLCO|nr:hypothetical protein H5410_003205 [Solanum commersonii]